MSDSTMPPQPTAEQVARHLGRMLRDRLAGEQTGHGRVEALDAFMAGLNDPSELEAWVPIRTDRYDQETGEHVPAEHRLYLNTRHSFMRLCLCRSADVDARGHPKYEVPELYVEGRDGHVILLFAPDGDDPTTRLKWHFTGEANIDFE